MLVIKFAIASHHHYEPYHSHHPTDAERRHDDIPWLILQLLIQTTTKHLRKIINCRSRKSAIKPCFLCYKSEKKTTVFPLATAATWLTALILSDIIRLLLKRSGGAADRLWQRK